MSLSAAINSSLRIIGTAPNLQAELLTRDKTKAKNRNETEYWDYKQSIELVKDADIAKLARHVLAFHNAKGGAIFYGIDDAYRVVGIDVSQTLDSKLLNEKLRSYVGPRVKVFQDFLQLTGDQGIWIVFIPPNKGLPVAIQKDGPADVKSGRVEIKRNTFFLRTSDESKACLDPIDICSLFTNVDASQQEAYALEIDEPYFRLLAPHCERFVGRTNVMDQVRSALALRHPLVSLDGLGGVGKSAVAIELTKQLYDAKDYEFIVSLSAKSRVWQGQVVSRAAGFSGFSEFLKVLAHSLGATATDDLDKLKKEVLDAMSGCRGLLLVDNIEDVKDEQILRFLFREVPDPVKTLVTSRIDRGMGALSVPIPEMNEDEARELFEFELTRQGYKRGQGDTASIRAIVETTGRIPLALKWSAAIAARTESLGAAEQIFRGAPTVKQEFLTFCFTTMFEGLSESAKAVALLNPYLERNWTLPILSIALDISEESVLYALAELEGRGVVVSRGPSSESMPSLLPLTKDFLAIKARQEGKLEDTADALLAAALGAANPLLAGLDPAKRVDILINSIKRKIDDAQLDEAERLVNVLRQILNGSENHWARFLAGQILFLQGKKIPGKELMQQAMSSAKSSGPSGDFEVTFGQLMIFSDSREDRHDGCLSLIRAAAAGEELAPPVASRIVDILLRQGDFPSLRSLISLSHKAAAVLQIAKAIERTDVTASQQKQHEIGPSLLPIFEEAAKSKSTDLSDYERHRFLTFAANLAKAFSNKAEKKR